MTAHIKASLSTGTRVYARPSVRRDGVDDGTRRFRTASFYLLVSECYTAMSQVVHIRLAKVFVVH